MLYMCRWLPFFAGERPREISLLGDGASTFFSIPLLPRTGFGPLQLPPSHSHSHAQFVDDLQEDHPKGG